MFATLIAGLALLGPRPFDFYSFGPYDASVPKPESVLGYAPGEHHTNFRDQERVISAIAAAAHDRVKVIQYGKTPEGRPLRILAISSPRNIARLEAIRQEHADLASGKGDPAKTVPIIWINECIHGDETASFESGIWTLYNLAAARGGPLAKALDESVVMLNPVYNADGHERYVVYYNSLAVGSSDPAAFEGFQPSTVYGRLNHYRFDMNRDRVAFSQDETRQEFAEMLRWGPQVYIDQHGQVNSYFFPPEPMSINPNVNRARNAKWTELFGRATGKAFDSAGFGYFTKDEFDLYYPGYLDSSTTLSGAIGMTHETDGGRRLASEREDGSILTLRRGMEKHFLSALTVVRAASENAKPLLADYAKFKRNANNGSFAGKFQRVVMTSPDPRPLMRLREQLGFAGIRSTLAAPFHQNDAHDYWTGAAGPADFQGNVLVVDMAQPQGPLAKALLEMQSDFEPEFVKAQTGKKKTAPEGEEYPGPEGSEFYDMTGWALPFAHNLRAWWCESAPAVRALPDPVYAFKLLPSSVGYALPYRDEEDALAALDALNAGVRVSYSNKPMTVGGQSLPRGTFLVLADRNDDGYEKLLETALRGRKAEAISLNSGYPEVDREGPGSGTVGSLRKPKIALVMGSNTNLAESGAAWFLLERIWHVPFTPISGDALSRGDLGRFTAIILPSRGASSISPHLKDWVSAGGHLVMLDAPKWAIGKDAFADLTKSKEESQSLPGSLFRAELDPRSPLSYGYAAPATGKIDIAVPISGDTFYDVRKEGGSIVAFSADEKVTKLLSGWEWPTETEKALRNTVFLQDAPIGQGHVLLFTQDPTDRAMWPGLNKLVLNSILFGGN
ncbi:M14 family zinc carboxypeptidase [Fimbriimonas ginsengisoli]|uniref:Zinc-dependent carboxypeptidase related domain containing protein n=1 Tax=Fimbriimonas ginsengisoli Gsoil 348 TaxID=661478 RepID=A0A068NP19_FIMGI|nr:M14 family zinc carboxypeptidase [Fimbriimonas ginsengisoli]AIE84495.1 Zinc-dependent carboxypeptidase related domain containing protein [Fimbriimonas ginsengisoli Gsoil 348]